VSWGAIVDPRSLQTASPRTLNWGEGGETSDLASLDIITGIPRILFTLSKSHLEVAICRRGQTGAHLIGECQRADRKGTTHNNVSSQHPCRNRDLEDNVA
jgi:hypothetical protein